MKYESLHKLSPRETEALILYARGRSLEEIGEAMVVTARTAESHLKHARSKLGITKRSELFDYAVKAGVLA